MKGTKDCWNIMCVCWCKNSETSNCMTEDIEPQDCGLADIDMRPVLKIAKVELEPIQEIIDLEHIADNLDIYKKANDAHMVRDSLKKTNLETLHLLET